MIFSGWGTGASRLTYRAAGAPKAAGPIRVQPDAASAATPIRDAASARDIPTCRSGGRRGVDHTELDAPVVAVPRDQHVSGPPRHEDRPAIRPVFGGFPGEAGEHAVDDLRPDPALRGARVPGKVRRSAISRGAPRIGSSGRGGSDVRTSRAAPASRPLSSASRSSASSTSPPRDTFTMIAPSGMSAELAGRRSCRGSPGEGHVERDDLRPAQQLIERPDLLHSVRHRDDVRVVHRPRARTNGRRRDITARPIRPPPTTPAVSSSSGGIGLRARQPLKSPRAWRSASRSRRWTARISARACVATSFVRSRACGRRRSRAHGGLEVDRVEPGPCTADHAHLVAERGDVRGGQRVHRDHDGLGVTRGLADLLRGVEPGQSDVGRDRRLPGLEGPCPPWILPR